MSSFLSSSAPPQLCQELSNLLARLQPTKQHNDQSIQTMAHMSLRRAQAQGIVTEGRLLQRRALHCGLCKALEKASLAEQSATCQAASVFALAPLHFRGTR